ncbi:MAG: hypothetical protein H6Q76_752 [Firmicutes bacterium]|nr:hypothetical protein [Bacillota bacterium]
MSVTVTAVWIVTKWIYDNKPTETGWHEPIYSFVVKVFTSKKDAETYIAARKPWLFYGGQRKNTYNANRYKVQEASK